jgi:hypothetical protein
VAPAHGFRFLEWPASGEKRRTGFRDASSLLVLSSWGRFE